MGTWRVVFTRIYASPCETKRREMWENLTNLAEKITSPWLLTGDFNDILNEEEQKDRGGANMKKCAWFRANLDRCKLLDLGSEGPKCTWRGLRTGFKGRLYKRLDWKLRNIQWRNRFYDVRVKVRPRVGSDHHPS
ncbi:uncharacterized protein LOC114737043 [Neltuma alba]|uniref:uncharacterized protein LOC114737043 n=1 Tax=Neltuma alba TaxID=207710 RepID=UPI0010A3361E|nr:uncharacterized protein LOC114737043 [Prosopis alba]